MCFWGWLPKLLCCSLTSRINERASSTPSAQTSCTPTRTRDASNARSAAAPPFPRPSPIGPPFSDLLRRPLPPVEEREGETDDRDDEVRPAIASLADRAHLLGDSDDAASASLPPIPPPPPPPLRLEGRGTEEEPRRRSRTEASDAAFVLSSSLLATRPPGGTSATQIRKTKGNEG